MSVSNKQIFRPTSKEQRTSGCDLQDLSSPSSGPRSENRSSEQTVTLNVEEWKTLKGIIERGLDNTPVGLWKKNIQEYQKLFTKLNPQLSSFI